MPSTPPAVDIARPPCDPAIARALHLPWPLPALLTWAAGWLLWRALAAGGLAAVPALALTLLATSGLALTTCRGPWRRAIAASGFPLSAWALGAAGTLPAWTWLLALAPLLAVYPLRAWRDAPLFPTPADALDGLPGIVGAPRSVLDAGCGLGHGLRALQRQWPQATLHGIEWSPLLALATRASHRYAQVKRGDMWRASWAGHDLVYLFQRPESMAHAFDKAARELASGAWLVSLEFAVPGQSAVASLQGPGRKPVWVYQPAGAAPPSITAVRGR